MNAFIIHSNQDNDEVKNRLKIIQNSINTFNPLLLENGGLFWKFNARKKISISNIIFVFIGKTSYLSPYIGWEINEAIRFNKQIVILKLEEMNNCPTALKYKDGFTKNTKIYGKIKSMDDVIKSLRSYEEGNYNVFNEQNNNPENTNLLFEQYKLFLQTSETLVQRRQNVNNFYITVNTILMSFCGTVLAFDIEFEYKMIIILVFSLIGIIISVSWINILISYGNLNSSKMKIISILEKNMPASLFDAEWEVLTDKLNNKKYVSFTESEKRIPRIFIAIYSLIMVVAVCVILFIGK